MSIKIAVALSIYKLDSLNYIISSIESILIQKADLTLFIQVDGEVSNDVYNKLLDYERLPNVIIEYCKFNKGLAFQLNQVIGKAVKHGGFKYLARMDADDICHPERFEKQIKFLETNSEISIIGSDVNEVSEFGKFLFYKKMDAHHADLAKKIIKKCPFNHPSVMFRMSVFEDGFRYNSNLMNTQDYYLWVDLLAAGKKFANINEALLDFRVNDSFHSRRGFEKAKNDLKSRMYAFKKLDVLTLSNIIHTVSLFLLRIAPTSVKKWAYRRLR